MEAARLFNARPLERRQLACRLAVVSVMTFTSAASGATLFEETFEEDPVGKFPFVGPGGWSAASQGGGGCVNAVAEAAASPIGSGKAVHIVDPSSSAGNLLAKWEGLGSPDVAHLSFQIHEADGGFGALTVVLGGDRGQVHFVEVEVGGGRVVAKKGNGSADVDPAGAMYSQGTRVTIDIVANAGAAATSYTTQGNLRGTAAADRYDVFLNGTLVIDDADPADFGEPVSAIAFRTGDAPTGVDVYIDNIRLESPGTSESTGDFSLSVSPLSQVGALCGEITYQVTVSPEGGFNGFVQLGTAGLPNGAGARFERSSVGPSGWTTAVVVSLGPTLSPGEYPFAVRGSGGGKTRFKQAAFSVTSGTLPQFGLSIQVHGSGTVTADPAAGPYACGQVVSLTATPDAGHRVKSWSGTDNDATTANSNTVTMTANKTVTVTFEPIPPPVEYTLTVTVPGGHGSVTPGGGTYASGTVVSLVATPENGYRVKSWSGTDNDATTAHVNAVTMTANKAVTVEFEALPTGQWQFMARVVGGRGTVSPTDGTYASGTVVTVTAVPDAGYEVKAWSGTDNDALRTNANSATMNANRVVTVEFEPATYLFPADADRSWSLSIDEVTAYAAAWRSGARWTAEPASISIDYVTRAAYLWRAGEAYHHAATEPPPLWWVPGARP